MMALFIMTEQSASALPYIVLGAIICIVFNRTGVKLYFQKNTGDSAFRYVFL